MPLVIRLLPLLLLASPCVAEELELTADSTQFAAYWSLLESGQADSAHEYLLGLGDVGSPRLAGMANFLLAHVAYDEENYASVPVLLDLGVPAELSDHAWALRARALTEAGQPSLAASYWRQVLGWRGSVLTVEAAASLGEYYRSVGQPDSALAVIHIGEPRASADERRALMMEEAGILSALGRHGEAVDRYWEVYSSAPRSAEGREALAAIRSYAETHGVGPRPQHADELARELGSLEGLGAFETGLNRIREASPPGVPVDRELLDFYRALFTAGLKRHRDALPLLTDFVAQYPRSEFRPRALVRLGRSAYLIDRDSLAIAALESLAVCGDDSAAICAGMKYLSELHMDRGRPGPAIRACERWLEFASRPAERADALWKLGWACWEHGEFERAAEVWGGLSEADDDSEYGPASLYWQARACTKSGRVAAANALLHVLAARYPYSYYSVILSPAALPVDLAEQPLIAPTMQMMWDSDRPHSRAFALLAAMRLIDAALEEWPAAAAEGDTSDGWFWWKAQLYLWQGDKMTAWRITRAELGAYIRSAGWRPPQFYRVVYPLDFDPTVLELSRAHKVDPYFSFGLICQESHFAEQIVSSAGAIGLMQLMPATARTQARKLGIPFATDKLYQGEYNLQLGIAHVAELWQEFSGDSLLVLAAYNAGKSAAQMWYEEFGDRDRDVFVEKIPYRETRMFVKRIVEHIAAYRRLYPDLERQARGGERAESPRP